MKNTRVQHFDILKQASLQNASKRPQDLLDEKLATQNNDAMLRDLKINTRKKYLLERRFIPHVGDMPFDHTSVVEYVFLVPGYNVAGFNQTILTYTVPVGTDLVVTQFNFFIMPMNYNPIPYPRCYASPLEFAANYSFLILVNGKQPIVATNFFGALPPGPFVPPIGAVQSGFVTLTENPEAFSPSYDGMHFVAPRGSKIDINLHCFNNFVPAPQDRNLGAAGARIRGFLTNSEDLDKMNK